MVGKSFFNKDRHGWNNRHGGKKVSLIRTDMVGIIDIPTTFYIWVMLALFAAPLSIGWTLIHGHSHTGEKPYPCKKVTSTSFCMNTYTREQHYPFMGQEFG